jgi:hypothetical protein
LRVSDRSTFSLSIRPAFRSNLNEPEQVIVPLTAEHCAPDLSRQAYRGRGLVQPSSVASSELTARAS